MRYLLVVMMLASCSSSGHAAEKPHLAFVKEYIRELAESESAREAAEHELADRGNPMATIIRNGTRIQYMLRVQIAMMKPQRLSGKFVDLPKTISELYEQKIQAQAEMVQIAKTFMAGPKPGVDYGTLSTRMPELTAWYSQVEKTLFDATPLIFATLIDERPDREGHISRLIITTSERADLLRTLQVSFGSKMDFKGDQGWIVGSASVLRDVLAKKGFKTADEP